MYPGELIRDNVPIAPFLLLSVVIEPQPATDRQKSVLVIA